MAHKHEPHHLPVEHEKPDEWHRHSAVEGTPQAEHTAIASPGVIAQVFIAICATVVVTVLVIVLYFNKTVTRHKQELTETTVLSKGFIAYRDLPESQLTGYAWADANAGKVRIPIDKAMERVVLKYAGKK